MTTYNSLKAELERQSNRLNFITDPQSRRILETSIADLAKALSKFPAGLIWCAEQPPAAAPEAG